MNSSLFACWQCPRRRVCLPLDYPASKNPPQVKRAGITNSLHRANSSSHEARWRSQNTSTLPLIGRRSWVRRRMRRVSAESASLATPSYRGLVGEVSFALSRNWSRLARRSSRASFGRAPEVPTDGGLALPFDSKRHSGDPWWLPTVGIASVQRPRSTLACSCHAKGKRVRAVRTARDTRCVDRRWTPPSRRVSPTKVSRQRPSKPACPRGDPLAPG
jgi:hypothetical protein